MKIFQLKHILTKNIITIIGSLVLVFSWYFEKIDTLDYQDIIREKRRQTMEFMMMVNYNTLNRGLESLASIMKNHDSTCVEDMRHSTLLLNSVLSSYTTQMYGNNMIKDELAPCDLNGEYLNYLFTLQRSKNIETLAAELYKQNDILNKIDLSHQFHVNNFIYDTNTKIESRQKFYLFFYIIGVLLITIDKGRQKVKEDMQEFSAEKFRKKNVQT